MFHYRQHHVSPAFRWEKGSDHAQEYQVYFLHVYIYLGIYERHVQLRIIITVLPFNLK